jgi:hypothetical protein
MSQPADSSFIRYLAAKRTVDDRALNAHVWQSLAHRLADLAPASGVPMTVLEIGAGIGTMVERLLEAAILPPARYLLLDAQPDNLAHACQRLTAWAATHGGQTAPPVQAQPLSLPPLWSTALTVPGRHPLEVTALGADLFDFLVAAGPTLQVDLLIAHAFIDLVDVPSTLARLAPLLRPGALIYLTINFDGATLLLPELDPDLDRQIEAAYHATMDRRLVGGRPSGDSHTGRHLFHNLQNAGIQVLDAGSSDWVVIPHQGVYPADEAYFLHFIVHTIHGALRGASGLDPAAFERWVAARHAQIDAGELVYIAHQLDYLGRYASSHTSLPSRWLR